MLRDISVFNSLSLFFFIPQINQNTAIGTSLFTVLATDADTGTAGVVQYSIDEVSLIN